MAKHIEDLSQFLQSFGVAALALLFLPVLIAALARNVALALTASLLSFTSLMLFIAPASASSGLAIVSGLGSFLVALESVFARRRMMAFDKQLADLTSRVNQLENAEQRRTALEVKRSQTDRARRRGHQSRAPGRDPDGPRNAGRRSLGSRAASQERSANAGHPDHRHVRACGGERAREGHRRRVQRVRCQTDRIRESGRNHPAGDRGPQIDVLTD
jgi:hypothetical protein